MGAQTPTSRTTRRWEALLFHDERPEGMTTSHAGAMPVAAHPAARAVDASIPNARPASARLIYVQANGRRLRLCAMNDKGAIGTGGIVASVLLVPSSASS